jgi:hypothetical protein
MPLTVSNDYVTLSAMITPALFMTATGSLIISTSNRMSRIVDRIRTLNDQGDALCRGTSGLDFPTERRQHVDDQLKRLLRRADRIRVALTMLYLAFAMFVGTSLTLGIDVLLDHAVVAVPTLLAALGVTLMLVATLNLVRETLEALRSNRLEITFYRDLRSRRECAPTGPAPIAPVVSASTHT